MILFYYFGCLFNLFVSFHSKNPIKRIDFFPKSRIIFHNNPEFSILIDNFQGGHIEIVP